MALLKEGDRLTFCGSGVIVTVVEVTAYEVVVRHENGHEVGWHLAFVLMDCELIQPAGRVRRLIDRIKTLERQLARRKGR